MSLRRKSKIVLLATAAACLGINACGGSSAANTVVVTMSPAAIVLVPSQATTITAIVTGATDVSATFACTYTTTPNPTTAVPTPKASAAVACTSDVGALSGTVNTSTTVASTVTFTAPTKFPDPIKFPNLLISITGTANANKKKTGIAQIAIDSGIRITITPATATLATGESKQFLAEDFTGAVIPNTNLKWDVTADATAISTSKTCTPGCGTVDGTTGTYTAPATVPTQVTATIFAVSTIDSARRAQAAITIVKAGDITFSGISPAIAAQGSRQQDIFLAAPNATSQIGVTLFPADANCNVTSPSGKTLDAGQIKVVFAAGATASAVGARIRLTQAQLTSAARFQVQVTSSNTSIKVTTTGKFCFDVRPVRPTIVAASPDNLQEATLGTNPISIDGGFFGTSDPGSSGLAVSPTVAALFNNVTSAQTINVPTARQITGILPTKSGSLANAGLFPVSVKYTVSPGPFPAPVSKSAFANVAVIPDYTGANPAKLASTVTLGTKATSWPSAIALDSGLGVGVITLAGENTPGTGASANINTANNVQFVNLGGGAPSVAGSVSSQGFMATGVAVDDQLHVAAVVNYASRTLTVHSIPSGTMLGTVDLSCVIPQSDPTCKVIPEPFPYSVGIDPFLHRALVAFASTNVGLIINLDPTVTPTCILPATPVGSKYCPISYVTLNSGTNPQIAFEAGAHLAYATPGGAGILSAVNMGHLSSSVTVTTATRASNVVTITTGTPHNLVPGNAGTVLISGVPLGKNGTDFNGSFAVANVLDSNNFQFSEADKDDTASCTAGCFANSGIPFLTYIVSPSTAGIAINPVTRQAMVADPNATSSQLSFIDVQSQSVTSMSLFLNEVGPVFTGSPELGATNVAFQPFTNTAISFNSPLNQISLVDPSVLQRLQFIGTTGQTATATATFTPPSATSPITVNLSGALTVDAVDNVALALNSGTSTISVFSLGTIKSIHIQQVVTPAIDPTGVTIPAQLAEAVKITSGSGSAAIGPVRILGAGFTTGSKVELDGVDIAPLGATVTRVSSQEMDVTFPAGFFTVPQHLALQVVDNAGVLSNVRDFTVLEEIPVPACSGTAAAPGGVAIDELHNLALVTNTACHQVSVISLDPAHAFGTITKTIQTGGTPFDVAVLPRLAITGQAAGTSGVAVVTNATANTVSILDLASLSPVAGVTDVAVGTAPTGVAINQETNIAVIANTNSNTVSTIDLTPLTVSPVGALASATVAVDQSPIAVAIDPDRGTNGRGLAVVTTLLLNGASTPVGALDAVDIGGTTPVKLASASIAGLQSTPTGVVFDPAVTPTLFYTTSTQGNTITTFNPDTNATQQFKVGINPTAIAYNFQTGTILTVNALSNSISILDSQTFRTKATLGIGGTGRFSVAIQTFTNLAVIVDQANNRVLLFPLPK